MIETISKWVTIISFVAECGKLLWRYGNMIGMDMIWDLGYLLIFIVALGIYLREKYKEYKKVKEKNEAIIDWLTVKNLYDNKEYDSLDQKIRIIVNENIEKHRTDYHR